VPKSKGCWRCKPQPGHITRRYRRAVTRPASACPSCGPSSVPSSAYGCGCRARAALHGSPSTARRPSRHSSARRHSRARASSPRTRAGQPATRGASSPCTASHVYPFPAPAAAPGHGHAPAHTGDSHATTLWWVRKRAARRRNTCSPA
jgi:hypothetical protein